MKRLAIILLILSPTANALELWQGDPKYKGAISAAQKAILAYPNVKAAKKKVERKIYDNLPVDKHTAGVIGSTVMLAAKGEVDTKVIKKMNFNFLGGRMRPNLNYNFKSRGVASTVDINWSF